MILFKLQVLFGLALFAKVLSDKSSVNQTGFIFQQNDYKMKFERAEVVSFNKDYMHEFHIATFKYNRTWTAFNITFMLKIDIEKDFEVVIESYKFASNEYREFPMRFAVDACDGVSKNYFGVGSIRRYGNYNGCPIEKGVKYVICNYTPDPTKFPPFIPSGRYMVDVHALYLSIELGIFRAYCEIYRPFTGK